MNRRLKHRLEFTFFQVLFQLTRLLPRRALLAVGRSLGTFVWKVVRFRRRVVLDNLTAAFGDDHDAAWIEQTAAEFWRHLGMTLVEFLAAGHRDAHDLVENVELQGHEILESMVADGQGALLMSGHFGNFELMLPRAAVHGFKTHGIAKRQSNLLIDAFYNGIRMREGVGIIYTGGSFPHILKVMQSGEYVGLLGDQDAGPKGQFVEFLGRPASFSRGPASLAVKAGVPIVMAFLFRRPDHDHILRVGPVLEVESEWDDEKAITKLTEMHAAELEKAVREAPSMYYWVHRRWKTRPPEPVEEMEK